MNGKERLMLALILAMQVLAGQAARDSLLVGVRPDGTELWTEEHHFDKRIERFDVMPGKPQMCLNFVERSGEGLGELGLYDVLERRLCWVSDFDFATDHYVMTSQGVVLQADKTTMLVDDSGRRMWESSFCPLYCDEESGMLIGAKKVSSKDLVGVSLADGKQRWKGKMAHWNGLNDVLHTEDGRLILASDQLGSINPRTVEMNVINTRTAYKPVDKSYQNAVIGAALGGLIGGALLAATRGGYTAYYSGANFWTGAHPVKNMLHGLSSNILNQDGRIYYADRTQLWCLDTRLTPLWQTTLPQTSSMSSISIEADTLFYVNYGVGNDSEGNQVEDTKAYAMAYDRQSGKKLYDFIPSTQALSFLKDKAGDTFTPLTLTYNELSGEGADIENLYVIERQLGSDSYCIHSGYDYWIVDAAGHVKLHFKQPIVQTAWIGNLFVALNAGNSIFQFDLSDL